MKLPRVGELRVQAILRRRTDLPGFDVGVDPEYSEQVVVDVKIEPVGTAVYAAGVQTDSRITHRVFARSLGRVSTSHEVVAEGVVYRVKRCGDVSGCTRFTVLEVEELAEQGGAYG